MIQKPTETDFKEANPGSGGSAISMDARIAKAQQVYDQSLSSFLNSLGKADVVTQSNLLAAFRNVESDLMALSRNTAPAVQKRELPAIGSTPMTMNANLKLSSLDGDKDVGAYVNTAGQVLASIINVLPSLGVGSKSRQKEAEASASIYEAQKSNYEAQLAANTGISGNDTKTIILYGGLGLVALVVVGAILTRR